MEDKTKALIDKISSKEIKACLSEAALLMKFSKNKAESKAASLTFVTLSRFGLVYDQLMSDSKARDKGLFEEEHEESLKNLIYNTGIYYFGPMFKEYGEPLKSRQHIMAKLKSSGYSTRCLSKLTDTQLDMFFTRAKETGLISYI